MHCDGQTFNHKTINKIYNTQLCIRSVISSTHKRLTKTQIKNNKTTRTRIKTAIRPSPKTFHHYE